MASHLRYIAPSFRTALQRCTARWFSPITVGSRSMSDGVKHPPDDDMPPIPIYQPRTNETEEVKRARLLYQSRKRGMLENGLLLATFADIFLDKLSSSQLDLYDNIINKPSNDWDIYHWVTGTKETPVEYDNDVMDMLKEHAKNKEKVMRNQQPPLKFST